MDATLTQIGFTTSRKPVAAPSSLRQAITRLCAAIVAGSDHPAFHTPNAASHVVLTTRGEQDRLLNAGLCPPSK